MVAAHIALGAAGEDLVAAWYVDHGYHVVARNWRTSFGEIDLVAARRDVVVICEVKTRRTDAFGSPAHAVTLAKRQRLRRLAGAWLAEHRSLRPTPAIRFDVAAVAAGQVQVFTHAF
jgi:putative endonuclease